MKVTQIFVVPHMHWDREWYFSTEESQVLLLNNMPEIMTMLENHPDYPCYVLDGQTVIIEDYLSAHPEGAERFKKLVKDGRLIVGPWYTQTDEMAVGAESITRNLLYGLADSTRYGAPMKIGYVPDSFGQSAQMPMILNQFGIQRSMFWRGLSEQKGTSSNQFKWQSSDGSTVAVNQMPAGYATGKYLPTDPVELKARLDPLLAKFDHYSTTGQAVLPNGHDQMPIQQNIEAVIKVLNEIYPERHFELGRYEDVFPKIETDQELDTVTGEFLDGKNERVHRSIESTRMDLKTRNTRIENKLTNTLEPLATIASKFGFEYQHGIIELIWKELMKNHAHDSMGACCSDKVNREILARYRRAEERTDRLVEYYQRKITEAVDIPNTDEKLAIFNLLPTSENRVITAKVVTKLTNFTLETAGGKKVSFEVVGRRQIDPGLIDRQIVAHGDYAPFFEYQIVLSRQLPAMGYEVLGVHAEADKIELTSLDGESRIENDFYQIEATHTGQLRVVDKLSGKTYQHVLDLEVQGDDGDEYDFSPLPDDYKLYAQDVAEKVEVQTETSSVISSMSIHYELPVPADLQAWQQVPRKRLVNIPVELNVALSANTPVIKLNMKLNNQADDLRIRLIIPTELSNQMITSDNQFGQIDRPVSDPANAIWQTEHWDERPDAIYPFLSYVGVMDGQQQVGVITNSSREYEALDDGQLKLAITLVRGVGVLGKANLVRRPGRPSGINAPTPDAQCHGWIELEYGIVYSAKVMLAQLAKEFLTPVITYNQIPNVAMHMNLPSQRLPSSYSLFSVSNSKLTLSTVKMSEQNQHIVARFYNQTKQAETISVQGLTIKNVLNLGEKPVQMDRVVRPNSVITLELS